MRPLDPRWPLILEAIAGRDFAVTGVDGQVTSVVVRERPIVTEITLEITAVPS